MNSRLTRTLTIAALAAAVAATAAVAAVASTPRDEMATHMGGQLPAHMDGLTDDQWAEMDRLMSDGDHAEMHEWMDGQDLGVGRMHDDVSHPNTGMGDMHGGMAGGGR